MGVLTPSLRKKITGILGALHISLLYRHIIKRGTFFTLISNTTERQNMMSAKNVWCLGDT